MAPVRVVHKFASAPSAASATLTTTNPPVAVEPYTHFAVFELRGRQHKVTFDDLVMVDRMNDKEVGEAFQIPEVLLVGGVYDTMIGRPHVTGAFVEVVVEEHLHLHKVLTFKKRRRKNSQRLKGKRPQVTLLRVVKINVPSQDSVKMVDLESLASA